MTDFLAGWRFALRRLRAGWRFMLVAAVGVLVASTLLAITPIYASAMSDLGLAFRLGRELPTVEERGTFLDADGLRLGDTVGQSAVAAMDAVTEARVGWLGDDAISEDRSQRFDISFPGFDAPEEPVAVPEDASGEPVRQPWGGYLFHLGGFEEHVEVVEGRLPEGADTAEVVLPWGFQRHAALGDVIRLQGGGLDDCPNLPGAEDPEQAAEEIQCEPTLFASTSVEVTVVGFVRPDDLEDERWSMFRGAWVATDAPVLPRLSAALPTDPRRGDVARGIGQMPLLTTQEQFDGVFRTLLPESTYSHRAGIVVDTSRIGLGEVDYAIGDLSAWEQEVRTRLGLDGVGSVDVLKTLQGYRTSQSFTSVPLLIMLLQVVGIVVYYVVMVMAMLLERQQEELGVYRSRGATTGQLVGLSFVEGVVLAVPALLVAPWLASQVVALLGRTPAFDGVTGGAALPAAITPEAYLLAVAGGVLSLLAILLPAFLVVRRGIVDVKREEARPAQRNVLQRYYLDFGVVALAGLLLWQLNQRGSVFDPSSVGGWSSDPLLLAAPLAITLAVSLMMLRFYPPLVRLAARFLLLLRGTAVAIGLRRAGRAPASYARVTLLVILAIAVGTFAASYGPTVDRSYEDRARYTAGIDLRGRLEDQTDEHFEEKLAALTETEGVASAVGVHRSTIAAAGGLGTQLLALDPVVATDALWWRDDFATRPLDDLMRELQSVVPPGGGYVLPEDAETLQLWINTPVPARLVLRARFRLENGSYTQAFLEPSEGVADQWEAWRVALPDVEGELAFAGLLVGDRQDGTLRLEGSLFIDDLQAIAADGETVDLDEFEGAQRWMMLGPADSQERFALSGEQARSGSQALQWSWQPLIGPRTRLLAPFDPTMPIAAVMDRAAAGAFRVDVGGVALANFGDIAVPIQVRAIVDYFPTLDPGVGNVIVNYDHLREAAGLVDFPEYDYPTELWVDFEDGLSTEQQLTVAQTLEADDGAPRIAEWTVQDEAVRTAQADPTLQAAGSGILGVAFVAVIGLCTVGFVATMVLGARGRATEFAVLRAVGVAKPEILRALVLEWGVVLVLGAAIGGVVGREVARIMMRFLNVTESGSKVLPPFVLETSWGTLGLGLGVLAGAVVASLLVAWAFSMRRSPTIELRVTQ
ncbi:MAG: FtsX-like permease family protein [Dehalococcoidia bacterium]|nr:FtsX-like permease family protein [Dehalococcoidia bacterium]